MVDKSKVLFLNSSFIKSTATDGKTASITIEGYASTTDIDRQGDVVPVSVWEKGIKNYLKNPVILAYHDHSEPVGRMVEHKIDGKGLWIKARISSAASEVFNLVKDGVLTAFSIGFRIVDAEYNSAAELFVVKELELHEISVVSVPANQNTLFSLSKAFDTAEEFKSFKMQFAPDSDSAKGLESSTEADSQINKEWNIMDPKQLEQMLADAANKAAEQTAKAIAESQAKALAEKAAADKAEAELDARVKAAVASISTGDTGAERLMAEVEKRLATAEESSKSVIAGLEAALKDKAAEIEAITKSKMSFQEAKEGMSYADKEKAVMLAKMAGKSLEGTKFGREMVQKYGGTAPGAHLPSATWELEVSLNMEAEVRRRLVVAPIFRNIAMQTNVMTIPVNPEAGLATWVTNTDFGAAASAGAARTGANGDAGNHSIKEITLNAYKLATNEYTAYEEEEDSLLALMPMIRDGMIRRVARSVDRAFLRGAGDATTPVKGLTGWAANTEATATTGQGTGVKMDVAKLRTLRQRLGAWGLDPAEVIYIVNTDTYYNLLDDEKFQTMNQVGTQATLLTGQIGQIGGSPVLVSAEYDSVVAGNMAAVCVNPGNFIVGNQRGLRIDTQELVETQRRVMVASLRTGMTRVTTNLGNAVAAYKYTA
jgi:HK97 family phage prohead protease/HK97 family phage major capsid protein